MVRRFVGARQATASRAGAASRASSVSGSRPSRSAGRPEVDLLAAWEIWQAYLTQPDAPAEVRVRRVRELRPETVDHFSAAPVLDDLGREVVRRLVAVKRDIEPATLVGFAHRS
jgi:hypothetical protein